MEHINELGEKISGRDLLISMVGRAFSDNRGLLRCQGAYFKEISGTESVDYSTLLVTYSKMKCATAYPYDFVDEVRVDASREYYFRMVDCEVASATSKAMWYDMGKRMKYEISHKPELANYITSQRNPSSLINN